MEPMSSSGPRKSTRRARWILGTLVVVAWFAWAFFVEHRLAVMEQDRLTRELGLRPRTLGLYLAWLLFFPPVVGLWMIVFPGDRDRLPWHNRRAGSPRNAPAPSRAWVTEGLRDLVESTRDRTTETDRTVVLELVDAGELAGALEHLATRLVEHDRPVAAEEGRLMEGLATGLPLSSRGHRDVAFLAAGLSGPPTSGRVGGSAQRSTGSSPDSASGRACG